MKKIEWKNLLKIGLAVLVVYLAIHYWGKISGFIALSVSAASPIFAGLIMAYAINILMTFYERHFFKKSTKKGVIKLRRPLCLTGAVITLAGIIALVLCLVIPQLAECVKMVIDYVPTAIDMLVKKLETFDVVPDDIINSLSSIDWKSKIGELTTTISSGVGNIIGVAFAAVSSVFSVASTIVIGFIFALYLLLDKDRLTAQLRLVIEKFLPERVIEKGNHILGIANDCFHKFIVGQCTEAVILGSLCMVGMLVLRLPYAPMIGALVAFTALIPIVGAFIGAGVGAFLILMVSPSKAVIFLVFIIVLQQIEGNLIYPRVVGSSMGLPGIWVLAAVTVGGGVMGIPGMMIGVPLMAVIYKLVKENINEAKFEKLRKDAEEAQN